MSAALLVFIVVGGAGVSRYYFIPSPLLGKERALNALQGDIDKKELAVAAIQKRKPDLERWKKTSLPADIEQAGLKYMQALTDALKASGFDVKLVMPRAVDDKNVPKYTNKKAVYTRLPF